MTGVTLILLPLTAASAEGETELLGPLRIRDMTPFNILRLDMTLPPLSAGGDEWICWSWWWSPGRVSWGFR